MRNGRVLLAAALIGLSGLAVGLPTAARADTPSATPTAQLTPSSLFVQGPYQSSTVVGAVDDIMGSLTIGGDAAPVGTPIDVTRTNSTTGTVAQFNTTTYDTLGDFEVRDPLPALGTYNYVISYPGNATTAPASYSDYEVTVEQTETSVVFYGPATTGIAGYPVTISGQLTPDPEAGLAYPPEGSVVNVTRTVAGSTSTATLSATTDAEGIFTITDNTAVPGTYTYTGTYTSDDPDILSSTGTWTVTVTAPTAPPPSVTYSGTIRLTKMGLCLDDRNNSASNGAIVQVWKCNGLANQQWQVYSDGTIRHDGLCLDATGYGTGDGTKVQLWACTHGLNQQWDTKDFRIHYDNPPAVSASMVLDDTGHGGNGTQQQIWTNLNGTNQFWETS